MTALKDIIVDPQLDPSCRHQVVSDDLRELTRYAASHGYHWQPIPDRYTRLANDEIDRRIADLKRMLGERVVILGHHYQRPDVVKFADEKGDSFKLAEFAADRPEAEFIVFCGVHFMAESADILSAPHQRVILPNLAAGCSMADMADPDDVVDAWDELNSAWPDAFVPITYMNSAAALKAFCGLRGGAVCTSSNAGGVIRWALEQRDRILFFPDEHLGRNVALDLDFEESDLAVWDYRDDQPFGGLSRAGLDPARFVLWKGYCSVHQRFSVDQVLDARTRYPGIHIVVHPECRHEVVTLADVVGSTELIARTIADAAPGSIWGIGTEVNLVNRLATENPDKKIFCLDPVICPCTTMYRVHPAYLLWSLEQIAEGEPVNVVAVPEQIAESARIALDRMLAIN